MSDVRGDLIGTLQHLGYQEIRLCGEDWQATESVQHRFTTTDETWIITESGSPTVRLIDPETREQVGTARRSCGLARSADLTNPDRDDQHRRRRETGNGDDTPDGREVAKRLYGGFTSSETDEQDHAE